MNPLAQIDAAAKLIDHAAQQDMRWWFLGLLVFGSIALWLVARYWAERHDRMTERLDKVQDCQTAYLKESNSRLAEVVADNAAAFKEFSQTISAVKHLFAGRTNSPHH